ncbi:MAG: hypothetical protein E7407_01990 [Ruminococcaceae bacterium]|nr:hypothetical protein [Oscillospiraceae bacterium]
MYKIKQRKSWSFFKFIVAFLALAAVGLGVGYAGAKLSRRTPEGEYVQNVSPTIDAEHELTKSKAASKTLVDEPAATPSNEEKFAYLVKYEEGQTRVFDISEGKKILSHTLPIEPASLRQEDLSMIREGVLLRTKEELLSFTEDFCS